MKYTFKITLNEFVDVSTDNTFIFNFKSNNQQFYGMEILNSSRRILYYLDEELIDYIWAYDVDNVGGFINGYDELTGVDDNDTSDIQEWLYANSKLNDIINNSFCINFYNNKAESNKLDKSSELDNPIMLCGKLRESVDLMTPSITIEFNELPTYNYCYIHAFKRYYFVDALTIETNKIYTLSLREDVLMSFKSKILQQSALIGRCEDSTYYNADIIDNEKQSTNGKEIVYEEVQNTSRFLNYGSGDFSEKQVFILTAVRGSEE